MFFFPPLLAGGLPAALEIPRPSVCVSPRRDTTGRGNRRPTRELPERGARVRPKRTSGSPPASGRPGDVLVPRQFRGFACNLSHRTPRPPATVDPPPCHDPGPPLRRVVCRTASRAPPNAAPRFGPVLPPPPPPRCPLFVPVQFAFGLPPTTTFGFFEPQPLKTGPTRPEPWPSGPPGRPVPPAGATHRGPPRSASRRPTLNTPKLSSTPLGKSARTAGVPHWRAPPEFCSQSAGIRRGGGLGGGPTPARSRGPVAPPPPQPWCPLENRVLLVFFLVAAFWAPGRSPTLGGKNRCVISDPPLGAWVPRTPPRPPRPGPPPRPGFFSRCRPLPPPLPAPPSPPRKAIAPRPKKKPTRPGRGVAGPSEPPTRRFRPASPKPPAGPPASNPARYFYIRDKPTGLHFMPRNIERAHKNSLPETSAQPMVAFFFWPIDNPGTARAPPVSPGESTPCSRWGGPAGGKTARKANIGKPIFAPPRTCGAARP